MLLLLVLTVLLRLQQELRAVTSVLLLLEEHRYG